jgi:hypothetical protein
METRIPKSAYPFLGVWYRKSLSFLPVWTCQSLLLQKLQEKIKKILEDPG